MFSFVGGLIKLVIVELYSRLGSRFCIICLITFYIISPLCLVCFIFIYLVVVPLCYTFLFFSFRFYVYFVYYEPSGF